MTEEERVREEIARIYLTPITDWNTIQYTPEKIAYICADQILSIKVTEGVTIKDLIEKELNHE